MKKCSICIFYRAAIIIISCAIFFPYIFNHGQYAVGSPEDGLPMRKTTLGYPCTYYWLNIDDDGNVYARTTYSLIRISDNTGITMYMLDVFSDNSYFNIINKKIKAYDMDKMKVYEYDMNGRFLGKYDAGNSEDLAQYNEIACGEITYRVEYTPHFSMVTASSMQNGVEKTKVILRALSKKDRTIISYSFLIMQVIITVLHLRHVSRHHRSKKL